ncbi:MAG: amidohydrolase family protein [Acidobacteria bacterium]|nr:amidohydrolase family protein [Acidobacteriota bacterium]
MMFNQKGLEESRKVFPETDVNSIKDEDGMGGANQMRWAFPDVVMKDFYPELKELVRLGHEWWAGYGMTGYSSNAYNPRTHQVYGDLDRHNQMSIRIGWTWNWRAGYFYADKYWLYDTANRLGQGTDYYWNVGGRTGAGGTCTTLEPLKPRPVVGAAGGGELSGCTYPPGSRAAGFLYEWIKAGNRYAGAHHGADKDVDYVMDIIEQASKDGGLTAEEIRAKRHTVDHSGMFPRPDQVDRMKSLNMAADGNAFEIYQAAPAVFETYGERAVGWVVPKKRLNDAGIINTFEMDRALGSTDITFFDGLSWFQTRKSWDGKVYGADQAIDRATVLKVATFRGAEFALRENVLGSLEPGKWADFLVLDRDFLTVPIEEFAKTRVLMTVNGGRVIHLVPSLAREIGMQPAGAQVTLGGPAAQW